MSKSERFKFGEINLPKDSLPSPDGVYEAIRDGCENIRNQGNISVSGRSTDSSEDSKAAYLGADHDEYSYCHFQYQVATERGTIIRSDNTSNNRKDEESSQSEEYSRVLYFENGQFAIESTQDLVDQRVLAFIGSLTDIEIGDAYEFYGRGAGDRAQDHTVIGAASESNGESGFRAGSQVRVPTGATENGEHTGAIDIEGSVDQTTDVVDETAEKIRLLGTRDSDSTDEILTSGTVVATWSEKDWPNDAETERRAETIREKIVPYLRRHA